MIDARSHGCARRETTRYSLALLPLLALAGSSIAADRPKADRHGPSCISDFNRSNPTPLPDGRLLFRSEPSRGQSYVASFKGGGCPGMHTLSTIIVDRFSSSEYCEGDKVRAIDPPQTIPGPICIIDHFEPYSEPPRKGR